MYKKANLATGTLSAQLLVGGTSLVLQTDEGLKFPATGSGNTFVGVIWGAAYSSPEKDATSEFVIAYRASGDTFTLTRGQEGTSAKQWEVGDNFMLTASKAVFEEIEDAIPVKSTAAEAAAGTDDAKFLTSLAAAELWKLPEGTLYNGKIVPSVASNNLTVALKGKDGNDPSATNPVYVIINGTLRTITAALSVTKNAGTNWCNAGSAELATKEIDYFVYLGYNATDGVVIGFARIPYANSYDDFSTTNTNEKYCAISTITNAAAADYYVNIGRFAATLSAGAGYTWSVPTFTAKNLIQRPIYETRLLDYTATRSVSGGTAPTYTLKDANKYRIRGSRVEWEIYADNASGGIAGAGTNRLVHNLPFINTLYTNAARTIVGYGYVYEDSGTYMQVTAFQEGNNQFSLWGYNAGTGIVGNDQSSTVRVLNLRGDYEI